MPLNGTGFYTPPSPEFPAVSGTVISADDFNVVILDIGEAFDLAFYRDGRAAATANWDMNGNGLLNVASMTGDAGGFTFTAGAGGGVLAGSWSFTAAVTGITASPGDNSTKLATTAYVDAAAFSSALPAQTGNKGKFTYTDGTSASWKKAVGDTYTIHNTFGGF